MNYSNLKCNLVLFLPTMLSGCISLAPINDYSSILNYKPSLIAYPISETGIVRTISIGEPLLIQKNGKLQINNVIVIDRTSKLDDIVFQNISDEHLTLSMSGEDQHNEFYRFDSPNSEKFIQISKDGRPACFFMFYAYPTNYKCDSSNKSNFRFTKKEIRSDEVNNDSFQQTLIYNGKIGNEINIGYREFSNNIAREAFSNEVKYDLSESKTVAYKGALIEILAANNQSITFKILKNFN